MVAVQSNNTYGRSIVIVLLVFNALDIIAVALRVAAKYVRGRAFALHDYMIFGALVSFQSQSSPAHISTVSELEH